MVDAGSSKGPHISSVGIIFGAATVVRNKCCSVCVISEDQTCQQCHHTKASKTSLVPWRHANIILEGFQMHGLRHAPLVYWG